MPLILIIVTPPRPRAPCTRPPPPAPHGTPPRRSLAPVAARAAPRGTRGHARAPRGRGGAATRGRRIARGAQREGPCNRRQLHGGQRPRGRSRLGPARLRDERIHF